MTRGLVSALLLVLLAPRPHASATPAATIATRVKSAPSPIVLGQAAEAVIEVTDLPGAGPIAAGVNVGEVKTLEVLDDRVRIVYRLPGQHYPQRLCLLLVRTRETDPRRRVHVVRLPMLARTSVPITTRRNSQVTLRIGAQTFGPQGSGPTGRLRLAVVVPPGVSSGEAVAIDEKGLETRRQIEIRQKAYSTLALVATQPGSASAPIAIAIAASDPLAAPPTLVVEAEWASEPREEATPLPLTAVADHWTARWTPGLALAGRRFTLRAATGDSRASATLTLPEAPRPIARPAAGPTPPRAVLRAREPRATAPGRLRYNLSLAAGLLHNTGALLSPRLTAELGADYPVGRGRLGGRLLVSASWSSQEVPLRAGARALPPASARVLLVPIGALVSYRIPLRVVSPYVAAGVIAQLVRSDATGDAVGEPRRVDVTLGALGLLGASLELGRGQLFLQAGYQHSRVDNEAVELLAGGAIVEAGYRIELAR